MGWLKNTYLRNRPRFYIPYTIVLGIIGLINFYFVFEVTPLPNDECIWAPEKVTRDSSVYVFEQVKIDGVTWQAGIRDGDRLLEINGVKIGTNARIANNQLLNSPYGDSALYTVYRNGEVFETKVVIKKLIQFTGLAFALLSFIWILVAFVVVKAKPQGESQILFYRLGAVFVVMSMFNLLISGSGHNPFSSYPWLFNLINVFMSAGWVFMPFLLVHFFWVFPRKYKIMEHKYTGRLLYLVPSLIVIFIVLSIYFSWFEFIPRYFGYYGNYIVLAVLGGSILISIVSLFRNYLRLQNKDERTAIFIILISYTVGVLAIIYVLTLANVLADNIYNSPHHFAPIVLIALVPISFGYAVFRYSLMDVSDVVKNAIMYGLATFTVAGIYFLVIYLIGQSLSRVIGTEYQAMVAAVIFIIFALIFQSTKDKFQEVITKRFYPEQFAYQRVLMKFSNDVATIVGLENILDSTRETFVDALRLAKFGILLKDGKNDNFILERSEGFKSGYFLLSNNNDTIVKLLDEKKAYKQPPVFERGDFPGIFGDEAYKLEEEDIYTCIPLVIKSKIIGFLLFGLKYSGAQFAGKDLDLLVAAANQTAVSIENARLYESEAEKIKMERDLLNARKIQESLLPEKVPDIKGIEIAGKMIPAFQVGGDYYDLIKIDDERFFVIIGDVSGKGLAASFYMSKLQTMMRLFCAAEKSPKEVLVELNEKIYNNIRKDWFITVSIGLFDLSRSEVKFCRAGHTPLLITNGKDISLVRPNGIGIGLEKGGIFAGNLEETKLSINLNDLYIFFSDGINEAMNIHDELFGIERLIALTKDYNYEVSADEMLKKILSSIDKFRDSAKQNDDITLVLVKKV